MVHKKYGHATEVLLLLAGLFAVLFLGFSRFRHHAGPSVNAADISISNTALNRKTSSWMVETLDDPYTGVTVTTAMNILDGDNSLVIRRTGNKLECYVNTGQMFSPGERESGQGSTVHYRFDDGKEINQQWRLSDDHQSLIYPGDPKEFLSELATSKTFAFGFKNTSGTLQTVTYDVAGLPAALQ